MEGKSAPAESSLRASLLAPESHATFRRRRWLPALALSLILLVFHVVFDWNATTFKLQNLSSTASNPFSLAFPGNETAGTLRLIPCGDGIECGYIVVPKDYFNASAGVAQVGIARRRATVTPSKGHVMINPGGPGGSGTALVSSPFGKYIGTLLGPQWDVLGFDPRGIGRTRPNVHCFPDSASQAAFYANTMFEHAYDVPNVANASDPANFPALVAQQRQFLALKEAQALACEENMNVDDLRYMGTASVVRDMDYMTEVLDGPGGKINYWGGSYGSILGSYLVNMLPNRIGYASIDAIADPVQWSHEPSHKWATNWTVNAEKTYQWFMEDCSKAGPALCPLANNTNESPARIEARLEAFMKGLLERPLPATAYGRPGYITSGGARAVLYWSLEIPSLQPAVAYAFAAAMATPANGSLLLQLTNAPGRLGGDLSRFAVTCADSPIPKPAPSAEDLAAEQLRALKYGSRFGTSVIFTDPDGGCEFWPTRGREPERFVGPWNASLEYPMLIISNTADPITPLASGLLINKLMPNSSTMVIQNGPGHGSWASPSACTLRAQQEYWAGHPPKNGTMCEISGSVFASGALADTPAEERELVDAARAFGKAMHKLHMPGLAGLL